MKSYKEKIEMLERYRRLSVSRRQTAAETILREVRELARIDGKILELKERLRDEAQPAPAKEG